MMLGNTGAFFAAQRKVPTAQDYPSMPDLFMFDGIENAGFGTHDATSTTWINLVTTNNLSLTGGYSWKDKAVYFDGTGGAKLDGWRTSPATVEFIFVPERTTNEVLFSTGNASMYGVKIDTTKFAFNEDTGVLVDLSVPYRPVAITYTADGRAYINSVATATTTGALYNYMNSRVEVARRYTGNATYFKGSVLAYRAHSHSQTAAEIAANYAVDKARFGLA